MSLSSLFFCIPTAASEGGPGQWSVSIFGISLGAGAWAAGNLEDLMISSEDLVCAAKAVASRWQSGELSYVIAYISVMVFLTSLIFYTLQHFSY